VDLQDIAEQAQAYFDAKTAARDQMLGASRRSIRASANAIRALHRYEWDLAHRLMEESRTAIDEGLAAIAEYPDLRSTGYVQDAQKEYAESRITEAVVTGGEIPSREELDVDWAPYLNGMAEAVGEARRHALDLFRAGDTERAESLLSTMDDIYAVLVQMDYPDAVTGNLRRSTDVTRGIMEKTRGDLSLSIVQRRLIDALEDHAREVLGDAEDVDPARGPSGSEHP
jgi:translin